MIDLPEIDVAEIEKSMEKKIKSIEAKISAFSYRFEKDINIARKELDREINLLRNNFQKEVNLISDRIRVSSGKSFSHKKSCNNCYGAGKFSDSIWDDPH